MYVCLLSHLQHVKRKDLRQHMEENVINHAHLQADFNMELKKNQSALLKETCQFNEKVTSVEKRLVATERSLDHFEARLEILESERKERHIER